MVWEGSDEAISSPPIPIPQALEALGEAIKPYLHSGPAGEHVMCNEIDTSGSLIEMTLRGSARDGTPVALELMVPGSMVRMVVSRQSDGMFGFGPRERSHATPALPPVGPTAAPAAARSAWVPEGGADQADAGVNAPSPPRVPPAG